MLDKIAFTVYPTTNQEAARAFYEQALGLAPGLQGTHGDTYWVEYDLPGGGCFAISNAGPAVPSHSAGGTVAFEVSDLDALAASLRDRGVAFEGDVIRGPRCRMVVCLDPDGNSLLLHQRQTPTKDA